MIRLFNGIVSILIIISVSVINQAAHAQSTKISTIDEAVKYMSEIDIKSIYTLSEAEKEQEAIKLDNAWNTLISNGNKSVKKLKNTYNNMVTAQKVNVFFALSATAVIWKISKLEESEFIAEVWGNVDQSQNYNYVFSAAFEAARTHDPKALPMLKALLGNMDGTFYVSSHAMDLKWPDTLEFIWGVYGYDGFEVLNDVLEESKNSIELKSAMRLLAGAFYLPARSNIVELTKSKDKEVRDVALNSLSFYCIPDDTNLLVTAAKEGNQSAMIGLINTYNRACIDLIDLYINSEDKEDNNIGYYACYKILSKKGTDIIVDIIDHPEKSNLSERDLNKIQNHIFQKLNTNIDKYKEMSEVEREKLFIHIPDKSGINYLIEDKRITHDQFIEAVKYWREKGRITSNEETKEVTEEQAFAVATPEDIKLLYDLRATFYERLSDEALYDVGDANNLIRNIQIREALKESNKQTE